MIFDKLDRKIKEMNDLRRMEEIKANKVQQESTDTRYRMLVLQVHHFSDVISFLYNCLQFSLSDQISSDIDILFEQLKKAVGSGFADKSIVENAEVTFKSIQASTKKEWGRHYSSVTSTTTSTLRVISGIDTDKVSKCLDNIKAAEMWTTDKKVFEDLILGLDKAENLIQSLSLDQEIIDFLKSMNSGKATVSDLNEKVLTWILNESLGTKIKLSFAGRY